MIEIKNIIFSENNYNFLRCLVCFINHLLPLRLKFREESFVALEDNNVSGLISLEKDTNSYSRFKITKLILEKNSQIAKQLTNYVISRYTAMGASSFYVVIDEKRSDLFEIFKNELNFRNCAYEYLFKVENTGPYNNHFLKPFKKEYIKDVLNFYNESINSFNRVLFSRQEYQFLNKHNKYVFYNDKNGNILGYFEVATKNGVDFYINFVIDFAYNIYLIDAIKCICARLKHKNKKFNLYIKVKDYFMNSKEILSILKENKMELVSKSMIFAKDYLREIKTPLLFKDTKIIFNDPTTA